MNAMESSVVYGALVHFVGGPWDGRTEDVGPARIIADTWRVSALPPEPRVDEREPPWSLPSLTQGEYRLATDLGVRWTYAPNSNQRQVVDVKYRWHEGGRS